MVDGYDEAHCWQYHMKLTTYEEDKHRLGLTDEQISKIKVSDFVFKPADRNEMTAIRDFIIKYEWLGSIPPYPTHYFKAEYKGVLAAVLIYTMPNAFSKIVGDKTKDLERLLARGASASWTPKNLASAFISWSVDYMVKNTQYRVFTAYSDPIAKELGTVYQAANWYYLGQSSGAKFRYKEPGKTAWVSDRKFRNLSSFKKYAKEFGIRWEENWSKGRKILWENIPEDVEEKLRKEGKKRMELCEKKEFPPKHKYVMVKGEDKRETKKLREELFKKYGREKLLNYPKNRGGW